MRLSLETHNVGAFVVSEAGAARESCMGLGHHGLPGSESMANGQWGLPRNLGDPVISTGKRGCGGCRTRRLLVDRFRRLGPIEANDEASRVVLPSEGERSAAGRVAGSRSVLIVLSKSGDGYRPDPMEGSGAPDHEPVDGTHRECIGIRIRC